MKPTSLSILCLNVKLWLCAAVWLWSRLMLKQHTAWMPSTDLPCTNHYYHLVFFTPYSTASVHACDVLYIWFDADHNQHSLYQISHWASITTSLSPKAYFPDFKMHRCPGPEQLHDNGQAVASYRSIEWMVCSCKLFIFVDDNADVTSRWIMRSHIDINLHILNGGHTAIRVPFIVSLPIFAVVFTYLDMIYMFWLTQAVKIQKNRVGSRSKLDAS